MVTQKTYEEKYENKIHNLANINQVQNISEDDVINLWLLHNFNQKRLRKIAQEHTADINAIKFDIQLGNDAEVWYKATLMFKDLIANKEYKTDIQTRVQSIKGKKDLQEVYSTIDRYIDMYKKIFNNNYATEVAQAILHEKGKRKDILSDGLMTSIVNIMALILIKRKIYRDEHTTYSDDKASTPIDPSTN